MRYIINMYSVVFVHYSLYSIVFFFVKYNNLFWGFSLCVCKHLMLTYDGVHIGPRYYIIMHTCMPSTMRWWPMFCYFHFDLPSVPNQAAHKTGITTSQTKKNQTIQLFSFFLRGGERGGGGWGQRKYYKTGVGGGGGGARKVLQNYFHNDRHWTG